MEKLLAGRSAYEKKTPPSSARSFSFGVNSFSLEEARELTDQTGSLDQAWTFQLVA
jgi:hypothetical protein